MKEKIETLYLEYFNDFLTVHAFADYHHMALEKAHRIIRIGRKLNHRRSK